MLLVRSGLESGNGFTRPHLTFADTCDEDGNDIEAYSWETQIIQAESTDYSSRAFRRLWRGPDREECAGCLMWQLNECYPAVSWSLLDSAMRPKLAYYVSRRNYASILRTAYDELWASNLTLDPVDVDLEVGFATISGGSCVHNETKACISGCVSDVARSAYLRVTPNLHSCCDTTISAASKCLNGLWTMARLWAVGAAGGVAKAAELSIATDDDLTNTCPSSDSYLDLVPGDDQIITIDINASVKIPQGGLALPEKHYG
ncbi:hypothetical protein Hte_011005 [Hypoxylon texense]